MDEAEMDEAETMDEGKKEKDEKKKDLKEEEEGLLNDPKGPTAHGNVAEEEEKEEEEEEIDIENMDEGDLKKFIEDVIADMVAAGELEGNIEGGEEEEVESEEEVEITERKKYGGNKGDFPLDLDIYYPQTNLATPVYPIKNGLS